MGEIYLGSSSDFLDSVSSLYCLTPKKSNNKRRETNLVRSSDLREDKWWEDKMNYTQESESPVVNSFQNAPRDIYKCSDIFVMIVMLVKIGDDGDEHSQSCKMSILLHKANLPNQILPQSVPSMANLWSNNI